MEGRICVGPLVYMYAVHRSRIRLLLGGYRPDVFATTWLVVLTATLTPYYVSTSTPSSIVLLPSVFSQRISLCFRPCYFCTRWRKVDQASSTGQNAEQRGSKLKKIGIDGNSIHKSLKDETKIRFFYQWRVHGSGTQDGQTSPRLEVYLATSLSSSAARSLAVLYP